MKKIIGIILVLLLIVGSYFGYKKFLSDNPINNGKEEEVKKLQIFDEDSNERMVAVMINNNHQAWPHAGLDKSVINYEIIVEGGITRIMALYKGNLPEKIGSVRSSRHYFLDYVLENDAAYIHWGGSDKAYSDMSSLSIEHVDGISYEGTYFYRDREANTVYEHTGFTKGSMIKDALNNLNIRSTSDGDMLLKYSVDEISFENDENAEKADKIEIVYSNYHTTNYEYDSENKVYLRSMSGTDHVDAVTGEQYSAKNIIVYSVQNITMDDYGRQDLYNTGSGEGYYITNGYAKEITWEKDSRRSKTVYKYKDTGEEIVVNDGNTWIQIQPKGKLLDIIGIETESNE